MTNFILKPKPVCQYVAILQASKSGTRFYRCRKLTKRFACSTPAFGPHEDPGAVRDFCFTENEKRQLARRKLKNRMRKIKRTRPAPAFLEYHEKQIAEVAAKIAEVS